MMKPPPEPQINSLWVYYQPRDNSIRGHHAEIIVFKVIPSVGRPGAVYGKPQWSNTSAERYEMYFSINNILPLDPVTLGKIYTDIFLPMLNIYKEQVLG